MKVAIISDTHDNTPAVVWIIEYMHEHGIEVAFHAGDIVNPGVIRRFRDYYKGHLHFVFGNNDGELSDITKIAAESKNLTCHNREMTLELEGKKLYMIHYSAIAEPMAELGKYDICIGGHDHVYRVIPHGKSLFINPGNTVTVDKWIRKDDKESGTTFVVLDLQSMQHEKISVTL